MHQLERPIALTCPECGGALRETGGTAIKEYRCHTGHRFGPKEVLDGQIEEVEHAFGVAERVLNERVELCRHMAADARAGGRAMGNSSSRAYRAMLSRNMAAATRRRPRASTAKPKGVVVRDCRPERGRAP